MIKSQIEALIKIYDYRGALGFAEELGNEMVVKLIQHCDLRLNMNYIQAQKTIREYRGTPIEHINDVKCRELVEYYLSLKIKQRKANLTDFVIGFNPFLVEFMQQYIEVIQVKRLDVVLECKHKTKEYVVSRQKLEMYYKNFLLYLDKEFNVYRDSSVNIAFLYHFIVYHADQKKEFQEVNLFGKLKEMNQELRNKAAHQFSFINDQDIKEVTGMTSNQILIGIEKLFIKIYSNKIKSKVFQVYDLMNEFIVEELNVY